MNPQPPNSVEARNLLTALPISPALVINPADVLAGISRVVMETTPA
jgi:hypothetical protein